MIPDNVIQGFLRVLQPEIKIIKHDQPGKAPKLPYLTWQEISNPSNGRENISYRDISGAYTEEVDINKTETIQIDAYTKTTSQNKNKPVDGYKRAYDIVEEIIIRSFTGKNGKSCHNHRGNPLQRIARKGN